MKADSLYTILIQILNLVVGIIRTLILAKFITSTEFGDFTIDFTVYIFLEALISSGFLSKSLQLDKLSKSFIQRGLKQMIIITIFSVILICMIPINSKIFLIGLVLYIPVNVIAKTFIITEEKQKNEMYLILLTNILILFSLFILPLRDNGLILQYVFAFTPLILPQILVSFFYIPKWYRSLEYGSNKVGMDFNLSIFGIVSQLSRTVDKWLIKIFTNAEILGQYSKMFEFSNLVNSKIRGPLEVITNNRLRQNQKNQLYNYIITVNIISILAFLGGGVILYSINSIFLTDWHIDLNNFVLILFYTTLNSIFSVRGVLFVSNKRNKIYRNWGIINLISQILIWGSIYFFPFEHVLNLNLIYVLISGPITLWFSSTKFQFRIIIKLTRIVIPLCILTYGFLIFLIRTNYELDYYSIIISIILAGMIASYVIINLPRAYKYFKQ